jgi:hypothetical protein
MPKANALNSGITEAIDHHCDGNGNTRRSELQGSLLSPPTGCNPGRSLHRKNVPGMTSLARLGSRLAQGSPRCARSFATSSVRRVEVQASPVPVTVVAQKKPIGGFRGGCVPSVTRMLCRYSE